MVVFLRIPVRKNVWNHLAGAAYTIMQDSYFTKKRQKRPANKKISAYQNTVEMAHIVYMYHLFFDNDVGMDHLASEWSRRNHFYLL
ncbi:hypothetical protein BSR42_04930 [Megasphaera cerevisiae]|nr:hypothetical protein BSR42_04930 [Megasphaera cerevisiae]